LYISATLFSTGHPKIRGFIFQGGKPSTQEAIFHAVPMIVFPIFADQDFNANRINEVGAGISMEIGELTEKSLSNAISSVLNNERYGWTKSKPT
jgi:glucuronosyltransferase